MARSGQTTHYLFVFTNSHVVEKFCGYQAAYWIDKIESNVCAWFRSQCEWDWFTGECQVVCLKKKTRLRTYKLLSTWALEKSKVHLLFNVQKIAKPAVPCLCCLLVLQRFAINFIQITISHFIHLKLPSLEPVSCRIRQQPSHLFTQQHLQFPDTILYLWRQRYLNNCSETRGFHICLT